MSRLFVRLIVLAMKGYFKRATPPKFLRSLISVFEKFSLEITITYTFIITGPRSWLHIQGSRVRSRPGTILSWRLIMKFLLPSAESFMKGCCQLQAKVCARLLVICLFKLAQEKSVIWWTDRPAMTIAVDLGRKATKQTNKQTPSTLKFQNSS